MMEFLTAAFLGLIEGLTEFIPVSSTAHLIVLVEGLKFPAPPNHVFEVFIQLGAIMAIVVLYWKKLWKTLMDLPHGATARSFTLNVIVATLPALAAGALGRSWIKEHLYSPHIAALMLILGGIIILLLEKRFRHGKIQNIDDIPLKTAFLIGICQMLALVPGVSRSGTTIMGSLFLGLSRPAAAEFSFFLAIPVMLAAVSYDTLKNWDSIIAYGHFELMLVGLAAAFITALVVVKLALKIISRYGFAPFAWYRIAAGICIFLIFR